MIASSPRRASSAWRDGEDGDAAESLSWSVCSHQHTRLVPHARAPATPVHSAGRPTRRRALAHHRASPAAAAPRVEVTTLILSEGARIEVCTQTSPLAKPEVADVTVQGAPAAAASAPAAAPTRQLHAEAEVQTTALAAWDRIEHSPEYGATTAIAERHPVAPAAAAAAAAAAAVVPSPGAAAAARQPVCLIFDMRAEQPKLVSCFRGGGDGSSTLQLLSPAAAAEPEGAPPCLHAPPGVPATTLEAGGSSLESGESGAATSPALPTATLAPDPRAWELRGAYEQPHCRQHPQPERPRHTGPPPPTTRARATSSPARTPAGGTPAGAVGWSRQVTPRTAAGGGGGGGSGGGEGGVGATSRLQQPPSWQESPRPAAAAPPSSVSYSSPPPMPPTPVSAPAPLQPPLPPATAWTVRDTPRTLRSPSPAAQPPAQPTEPPTVLRSPPPELATVGRGKAKGDGPAAACSKTPSERGAEALEFSRRLADSDGARLGGALGGSPRRLGGWEDRLLRMPTPLPPLPPPPPPPRLSPPPRPQAEEEEGVSRPRHSGAPAWPVGGEQPEPLLARTASALRQCELRMRRGDGGLSTPAHARADSPQPQPGTSVTTCEPRPREVLELIAARDALLVRSSPRADELPAAGAGLAVPSGGRTRPRQLPEGL